MVMLHILRGNMSCGPIRGELDTRTLNNERNRREGENSVMSNSLSHHNVKDVKHGCVKEHDHQQRSCENNI